MDKPETTADRTHEARHRGPPLLAVAIVHTLLSIAGIAVSTAMAHGEHFPSPFGPETVARAYFGDHGNAVRANAFLQFGAAIPLGIFAATAVSRLQFLKISVAGVSIASFGGTAASVLLAMSSTQLSGLAGGLRPSLVEATRPA
jgi:hypothetical protein